MSDSDLDELRLWADAHAPAGSRTAVLVRSLIAEHEAVSGALARSCRVAGRLAAALRAARRSDHPCAGVPVADLLRLADDGCPLADPVLA